MVLRKHILNFLIILGLAAMVMASCTPKQETSISISAEATAQGPFFTGPNSLINEYTLDLSTIKGLENVSLDAISQVKLSASTVKLRTKDGLNFTNFQSAGLQLVGKNTGMQTIAIKNPIISTGQQIKLDISQEAELTEYFKGGSFSIVLDLDFKEDSYEEEIGAVIDFDLSVTHK